MRDPRDHETPATIVYIDLASKRAIRVPVIGTIDLDQAAESNTAILDWLRRHPPNRA